MLGLSELGMTAWWGIAFAFLVGVILGWLPSRSAKRGRREETEILRLRDDLERARQAQAEKDRRLTLADVELVQLRARLTEFEARAS
ncbi:MAG: hypothetical protein AAGD04_00760 [Pseudomonadota bacterium]